MSDVRIKICGVRTPEIAAACARAGVDMIGLNFAPASRRRIGIPRAQELAQIFGGPVAGVFVDADILELTHFAMSVPLSYLQLHGSEPPELCRELSTSGYSLIKALDATAPDLLDQIDAYRPHVAALLLDGSRPGSGQAFSWAGLARHIDRARPFFLAGGLHAGNIAAAIATLRPEGVDTASGVETDQQIDATRIQALVTAVRCWS